MLPANALKRHKNGRELGLGHAKTNQRDTICVSDQQTRLVPSSLAGSGISTQWSSSHLSVRVPAIGQRRWWMVHGCWIKGCVPSKTEPLIPSPPVAVLSTLVHSLTRALNILTFVPKTQVPSQFTIVHSALARPQIGISDLPGRPPSSPFSVSLPTPSRRHLIPAGCHGVGLHVVIVSHLSRLLFTRYRQLYFHLHTIGGKDVWQDD